MTMIVKPGYHWMLAMSLEKQGKWQAARDELQAELKNYPSPQVKRELESVERAIGH